MNRVGSPPPWLIPSLSCLLLLCRQTLRGQCFPALSSVHPLCHPGPGELIHSRGAQRPYCQGLPRPHLQTNRTSLCECSCPRHLPAGNPMSSIESLLPENLLFLKCPASQSETRAASLTPYSACPVAKSPVNHLPIPPTSPPFYHIPGISVPCATL